MPLPLYSCRREAQQRVRVSESSLLFRDRRRGSTYRPHITLTHPPPTLLPTNLISRPFPSHHDPQHRKDIARLFLKYRFLVGYARGKRTRDDSEERFCDPLVSNESRNEDCQRWVENLNPPSSAQFTNLERTRLTRSPFPASALRNSK